MAKLNPAGNALLYSTYLGGNSIELLPSVYADMAVTGTGIVYLAGTTRSTNLPTTANAFQQTIGNPGVQQEDAFVAKIDTTQSGAASLLYCSYLGSNGYDGGYGVGFDSQGNIYVAGKTTSSNFPITATTAYQSINAGGGDVFVSKINPNVSGPAGLVYSTFLGGPDNDLPKAMQVNPTTGVVTIAGLVGYGTASFPTTPDAYKLTGPADTFVARVDPSLSGTSSLVYSTYLGLTGNGVGEFNDGPNDLVVDSLGQIYLTGSAGSSFPVTSGTRPYSGGPSDAFLTILDPRQAGDAALVYSTFIGGSTANGEIGDEFGMGIARDASGNIYLTGWTRASDFPTTAAAYKSRNRGKGDTYVVKFAP